MKIYYVSPNHDLDCVEGNTSQEKVVNHPEVMIYDPAEFAIAFNHEEISDLGYIAVTDDGGNILKE